MLTFGKNQTVDPQPQDQLIAWMEDAHKKVEKVIATHRQRDIDEDLRRYAEWASVIQRS
jgi:Zn ribbon nucleic-acid-binding protein